MKFPRRRFLQLAALPAVSQIARALDSYPTRAVRLLVGYAAGGPADTTARLTAQWLSERLGRQVLVENRVGAGSNIAAETVIRSPPDGYTLLFVTVSNAVNATLYEKLGFDLIHEMTPIASISRSASRSEEHTSELQSQSNLVCRLLLEKKKKKLKLTFFRKKKKHTIG